MFGKRKNEQKKNEIFNLYLSIDIGTEYVKSATYIIQNNEINIVGYSRKKQKESSMYAAFVIDLQGVISVVDESIGEAISMARDLLKGDVVLPKEVIIGIAGELVNGVSILVNVDRENSNIEISEKELEDVVLKVKKQTFENTKEEISEEFGLKVNQIEEVSTYINSVYIDGVKVINPIGYKGNELVYKVFSTFAPRVHLDTIRQITKALNLKLKHIVVEPYALTLGLKNLRDPKANAIIIDIGGGTTDIALVQNGDIVGTKMFAIGGKVFTSRVQKELGITWDEAEEIKQNYCKDSVTPEIKRKLSAAFNKDIDVWLTGVEIALEDFKDRDVNEYPPVMYLCGGGALLPEIMEGLITYPWMKHLNFKKFPKISFVFPNSLRDVIDRTRSATEAMDVTPLSLARMSIEI